MTSTIHAYQPIVITSTAAPEKLILDYIGPLDSDLTCNAKAVALLKTIQESETQEYHGHIRAALAKLHLPLIAQVPLYEVARARAAMRREGQEHGLGYRGGSEKPGNKLSLMKGEAKS
jgi:hypothetical protein